MFYVYSMNLTSPSSIVYLSLKEKEKEKENH